MHQPPPPPPPFPQLSLPGTQEPFPPGLMTSPAEGPPPGVGQPPPPGVGPSAPLRSGPGLPPVAPLQPCASVINHRVPPSLGQPPFLRPTPVLSQNQPHVPISPSLPTRPLTFVAGVHPLPTGAFPPGGPPELPLAPPFFPPARRPPPPPTFPAAPSPFVSSGLPPEQLLSLADQQWLKEHAKKSCEDSLKCVSMAELRKAIVRASRWLRKLKANAEKLAEEGVTENQCAEIARESADLQEKLHRDLDPLTQEDVLRRLKLKLAKRSRHRSWKKRRKMAIRVLRSERQERREKMQKEQDDWRLKRIAAEKEKTEREKADREARMMARDADRKRKKQRELRQLIQKLRKLRDVRRAKLKRAGHFFPEEDDEFFNRVAAMNAAAIEEEQAAEASEAQQRQQQQEREKEAITETVQSPVKAYWRQADTSVENLIQIRRKWDAYIVPRGTKGASRIPSMWVDPAPPGNAVWASYLCSGPVELSESDECDV